MGRKQRDMSSLKPFCYYCEKAFKNQIILHHHQKAKHFNCPKCPKKFSSIDSMIQHAKSSHNENVERVPNSNSGRDNVGLKIFGMQGVPRLQMQNWISKNVNRYWGKIIDRKVAKRNKLLELKRKEQKSNKQGLQEGQKNQNQIEEEQREILDQQLDFPLEFNVPQTQN